MRNVEFIAKMNKVLKNIAKDEFHLSCPINNGKCFRNPPHQIPCSICLEILENARKREDAMKNEKLLFMRAKRKW